MNYITVVYKFQFATHTFSPCTVANGEARYIICNLSLSSGIYPSKLKIAQVITIYKKSDVKSLDNYKTISILCTFDA